MDRTIRFSILAFGLVLLIAILFLLKKGRIPVKFSMIWFLVVVVFLLLAIFPSVLGAIGNFFGFEVLSSIVVGILFSLLMFLTLALTIIVSGQSTKINLLIQEISLLKKRVETLESAKSEDDAERM